MTFMKVKMASGIELKLFNFFNKDFGSNLLFSLVFLMGWFIACLKQLSTNQNLIETESFRFNFRILKLC